MIALRVSAPDRNERERYGNKRKSVVWVNRNILKGYGNMERMDEKNSLEGYIELRLFGLKERGLDGITELKGLFKKGTWVFRKAKGELVVGVIRKHYIWRGGSYCQYARPMSHKGISKRSVEMVEMLKTFVFNKEDHQREWIYIYYFFIRRIPTSPIAGLARINAEERDEGKTREKSEGKERDRGTEGETPNSFPANWCAHKGWKTGLKTEKKKETGTGPPTQLPRTFQSSSTTRRDHTVNLSF